MGTSTSKREWDDVDGGLAEMASLPGRWLWVADEVVGSRTQMLPGDQVKDLLDDYAAGYDAGDYDGRIRVWWELWQDGEEIDSGTTTFVPS